MSEEEKKDIRNKRRYADPFVEGSVCFIDEEILIDDEKILYKNFLKKQAIIVKSIEYCHVFGRGYSYIHKLSFDNEIFDVMYFNGYVGYIPTEILVDLNCVSVSYLKNIDETITTNKLIELGFKVCD